MNSEEKPDKSNFLFFRVLELIEQGLSIDEIKKRLRDSHCSVVPYTLPVFGIRHRASDAARIYLKFIHAKTQRAQRAQREEGKGKILIFFFSFVFLGVLGVLCAFAS